MKKQKTAEDVMQIIQPLLDRTDFSVLGRYGE
jgi:hypothetical protein